MNPGGGVGMRRIILTVFLFALPFVAIFGCKKGGPTSAYDAKPANTTGNLLVGVSRQSASGTIVAQQGITTKITDYLGAVFTKVTDYTGTTSFDFDYATYSANQSGLTFKVEIPTQEHYSDTICDYVLNSGANTFLFSNNPVLTVSTTSSAATSYRYDVTNNLCYNIVYDRGGKADIPISLMAANLPVSWSANYANRVLGGSVSQTLVTFVIPAYAYQQNPISFLGYFANGSSVIPFVNSSAITIKRGFDIPLTFYSVQVYDGALLWNKLVSSGVSIASGGFPITWACSYACTVLSYKSSGSGTITGDSYYSLSVGQNILAGSNLSDSFTVSNSDAGTFTFNGTTTSPSAFLSGSETTANSRGTTTVSP
jgi:hypothetical protein